MMVLRSKLKTSASVISHSGPLLGFAGTINSIICTKFWGVLRPVNAIYEQTNLPSAISVRFEKIKRSVKLLSRAEFFHEEKL